MRSGTRTAMLMALLMAASCPAAWGGEQQGFVSLFNGKNLEGWIGNTSGYAAKDGTIVCAEGVKGNLMTEKEYSDFILRFDFKLAPGTNNGLAIRSPGASQGSQAYKGMELQILDDSAEKWADLKDWQFHGSLYGCAAAERGHLKPVGEWNRQVVIAHGPDIVVILNGSIILSVNTDKLAAEGTPDGREHPGLKRRKGHIGFLGHGDPVAFRNIAIKELK